MVDTTMHRLVLIFAILVVAGLCMADGMPIKNGRFEGKVSIFELTQAQREELKTKRNIELTTDQKRVLQEEAGVAPSVLYIYFTKDGENECTCCAWNRGLMFNDSQIEVPHSYLVSDAEAKRLQKELEGID